MATAICRLDWTMIGAITFGITCLISVDMRAATERAGRLDVLAVRAPTARLARTRRA
jgi:hypothetical protein